MTNNSKINFEKELNEIRVKLWSETRNLKIEERTKRTNEVGLLAAKKYGFKIAGI